MRSFFRFMRNLLLIALIAFGVHYYQQNPQVRQATNDSITTLGQRINQLFTTGKLTAPRLGDSGVNTSRSQQRTSLAKETGHNHEKTWSKPQANVYVKMSHDLVLRSASIDAINAWNRTGAFTFHLVNKPQRAQVVMSVVDDSSTAAAGETATTYNPANGRLLKANVTLNKFYLQNGWYGYDNNRIVNTAEHELGHAIGLNHTNGVSVMYPKGSLYTIQPQDIKAVKKIYHEK